MLLLTAIVLDIASRYPFVLTEEALRFPEGKEATKLHLAEVSEIFKIPENVSKHGGKKRRREN